MHILSAMGLTMMLTILACVMTPITTFAVINGERVLLPSSHEKETIRRVTVRLILDEGDGPSAFCSGTVISPTEIYTVGHCFHDFEIQIALNSGFVSVEFSSPNHLKRPIRIPARSVHFLEIGDVDTALLTLAQPSPYLASIPFAFEGCDPNQLYIVAGFGLDESGNSPDDVRLAYYRQTSADERAEMRSAFDVDFPGMHFFHRVDSSAACFGDSGGPIFCRSNGHLALVGANTMLTRTSSGGPKKTDPRHDICKLQDVMFSTSISNDLKKIQRWQEKNRAQESHQNQSISRQRSGI